MIKEFGGYFSLEKGKNQIFNVVDSDVLYLNAARYAIVSVAKEYKFENVYIPCYMCDTVTNCLDSYDIKYKKYNIDKKFQPEISSIDEHSVIVYPNYFGHFSSDDCKIIYEKYHNVIFDNTQALFSKPLLIENVFNVYSPRKFVGVSDGAILISKNVKKPYLLQDKSASRSGYIFYSLEEGTNSQYHNSLLAEKDITESGIREMSSITKNLLSNYDYPSIRGLRKTNYGIIHDILKSHNELSWLCDRTLNENEIIPMVYPLLLKNGDLVRRKLVENKIYIPQWWKCVLLDMSSNMFERYLSDNLLPIPMDQRYSNEDMLYLGNFILSIIGDY